MKTSESITKIAPALLAAQKATDAAIKSSKNPYFKSTYADINSVIEAAKKPLNDNGIVILQPHVANELGDFVETILLHESGEWMQSETRIVCKTENDPQAFGSATTYARRYGLQSFDLLPADDDDAEGTMNRNEQKKKQPDATTKSVAPVTVDVNAKYQSLVDIYAKTNGQVSRAMFFEKTRPFGIANYKDLSEFDRSNEKKAAAMLDAMLVQLKK